MNMFKRKTLLALATVSLLAGAGCASGPSRGISADGAASDVVFPDRSRALLRDGTYPTVANVSQIGSGVTKDQLYNLLGRPHFREGFNAREWDYILNFREGDVVRTCQYKVLFDGERRGRSFHWLPQDCASILDQRASAPVATAAAAPAAGEPRVYMVEGTGLFAFDRSSVSDLTGNGRAELDRIARELRDATDVRDVEIQAHTDMLGSEAYNLRLSQERADSVREYLAAAGVDRGVMRAIGMGKGHPVKQCDAGMARQALIDCLAPNRRVQIRASTTAARPDAN